MAKSDKPAEIVAPPAPPADPDPPALPSLESRVAELEGALAEAADTIAEGLVEVQRLEVELEAARRDRASAIDKLRELKRARLGTPGRAVTANDRQRRTPTDEPELDKLLRRFCDALREHGGAAKGALARDLVNLYRSALRDMTARD